MPHSINPKQIKLPRTLVNQLMKHAQSGNGKEVCGFIVSHKGRPTRTVPINNIAIDANKRFEMEPRAQISAIKEMREQGEELFAIYHSHPTSPATPSQIDIDEFSYPKALSLIISLNTLGVLEIRAFQMVEDHAVAVVIEVK